MVHKTAVKSKVIDESDAGICGVRKRPLKDSVDHDAMIALNNRVNVVRT